MSSHVKTSVLWSNLDLQKKDEAKCRDCLKLLSCKGGFTVGLKRHLEKVHNLIFQKEGEDEPLNKENIIR